MRIVHSLRVVAAAAALVALGSMASAQVSLTNGSPTYTQNFDALLNTGTGNAWTDGTTIANWHMEKEDAAAVDTYNAGTGSSNAGQVYSFGAAASSERCLGTVGSGGTDRILYGVRIQNDGTTNITNFAISYTGEQWRDGAANTNADPVNFYYLTSAGDLASFTKAVAADPVGTGGYTLVPSLGFAAPIHTGGSGVALDGNLPANQVAVSGNIAITLAPGSEIFLAWHDIDHPGSDHGLGIDNLTVTATFASASDTWTASTGAITFDDAGHTPVDFTNAPFTKTVTVNATGTTVIGTVTGLSGDFSFTGAVPPLGTTLNNGDSQVLTFAYNPTVNDGSTMTQQTATINATTGLPASNTVTLDGGVVRDTTIAAWRTYVEAGNPVAGIKWKMTDGFVGSNTLRPSATQNVITVQDRTDGNAATRGFYVFDNTAQGGTLPAVGAAVAVYGTAVKFQGLWEIVPDRPHVAGAITPTITPVSVAANAIGDNHESVLIRVNSASVAAGTTVTANTTTTFTTAGGNLDVQVFSDNTTVNQAISAGVGYDIIGIGYQSDAANNFNAGGVGYRLLPRATADFITPATAVETWSMY